MDTGCGVGDAVSTGGLVAVGEAVPVGENERLLRLVGSGLDLTVGGIFIREQPVIKRLAMMVRKIPPKALANFRQEPVTNNLYR